MNRTHEVAGSTPAGSIPETGGHRSSAVEHSIRNRAVVGSIPTGGSAGVAQLVERNLAKVEVASSNLVTRSVG